MLPFVGGAILTWVLVKAVIDYSKADGGYAKPFLGIGSPIAIALLMVILGLVGMLIQRITIPGVLQDASPRSSTRRVLAAAPAGALVMSSGIIVGYDGSDCAKAALRAALEVGQGVRREGHRSRSATSSTRSPARSTTTTRRSGSWRTSG